MSNTSYVKAITSMITSYSPSSSVLVNSNLPSRFYFRGLTVTMGAGSSPINPIYLVLQDGSGQGGQGGFFRITGGSYLVPATISKLLMPEDSYVLIKNGLYFWTSTDIISTTPLQMTVFYT